MNDSQSLDSIDSQIKKPSSRRREKKMDDEDEEQSFIGLDNTSVTASWDQLSTASRTLLSREQPRVQQVCGSQFKSNLKTVIKCKFCDELKFSLKNQKDVNRRLKIKLQKFQENEKYQKESQKITELLFSHSGTGKDANEVERLNRQMEDLSRTAKDSKEQSESLLKQMGELRNKYEQALSKGHMELKSLNERLDRTSEELDLAYKSKDTLFKQKTSLEENNRKLQELLSAAVTVDTSGLKELENLRQQTDSLAIERTDLQDEIKKLKTSISRQSNQVVQDKAEVQRLQAALQVALEEKKSTTQVLEESLGKVRDMETLRENLSLALQEERTAVRNTIIQSKNLESELCQAKAEKGELLKELEELRSKVTILNEEMTKERETSTKNLEKAISQSVRLVVVAPSVNVNVANNKVEVKSTISEENLRTFLEELLREYSLLYKQENSDLGPDNKTPINQWLSELLGKMQESIEQHVQAATAGSTNT